MTGPDRIVMARTLTRAAFAPFGDVIDADGPDRFFINDGRVERIDALGRIEVAGEGGFPGISIFRATAYETPLTLDMVERHPLGSQAFMPLAGRPFLVIVCRDEDGVPGAPEAFLTASGQGVNYRTNVWHGILTPLRMAQDFLVVDRCGEGDNLEVHRFATPYEVRLSPSMES